MVPCTPWAVDDGQPSWACSLDITPVLGPPVPAQHGTHLPKSCQSQHALLICPILRPGSHGGSHTLLVPTSKAVCNGQVVLWKSCLQGGEVVRGRSRV